MSAGPLSQPKPRRISPFNLRKAGPLGILYHGLGLAAIFALMILGIQRLAVRPKFFELFLRFDIFRPGRLV